MPVPTDITAGTLTITNGSTAVTGAGTSWLASDLRQGDVILWIEGGDGFQTPILADVPASNTALVLAEPWGGPTLTDVRYRIRYQWDSSRVSAQSRQLIELLDNGNVLALTGLTGPGVPVFDGPHSMVVKPESDFVNGVAVGARVETLAERDAYDGQSAGFSVQVQDVGDGRMAIYFKNSNTIGDWSAPGYLTGPVGPLPVIEAGTATRGPLAVDVNPITGGYELNITIPTQTSMGNYSGATAYLVGDFVQNAGSSWVALQNTTGNAPPTFPVTSNAYWQLLARAGNDGAGTVTALAEGDGINIDSTDPTMPVVSVDGPSTTVLLDTFDTTRKGVVPQPSTGDATSGRLLAADGTWSDPPSNEDLEFTIAQVMMGLADSSNNAQFFGPRRNRFADSYDSLTYVDVSGATNLDTSSPGVLKPTASWNGATFLAHMDGAIGSSSFPDSIGSVSLVSTGTQISDTQSKFGSRSAFFTSTSYILADGSAGFTFGTGDFTIDFWIYPLVTTAMYIYDGRNSSSQIVPLIRTNSSAMLEYFVNGSVRISGTTAVTANSWHHVAISRVSGTTRMFLDGVQEGVSWTDASNYLGNASRPAIGTVGDAPGNSAGFNGYMDELRVSKGIGQYVSNFTPATAAYSALANNMTARSTGLSAISVPTSMKTIVYVREIDSAVAGTDYMVDVSRDAGTTWSAVSLDERYSLPSGLTVVEGLPADVSGQPSGTSPAYRIRTVNNKNVEFHDFYMDFT